MSVMMSTLHVVAEDRRREILRMVWERELPAGEIAAAFEVTFGAVSQHLKVLREAGLVEVRADGRRRLYKARREGLGPLADLLELEWRGRLDRLRALAEHKEGT